MRLIKDIFLLLNFIISNINEWQITVQNNHGRAIPDVDDVQPGVVKALKDYKNYCSANPIFTKDTCCYYIIYIMIKYCVFTYNDKVLKRTSFTELIFHGKLFSLKLRSINFFC